MLGCCDGRLSSSYENAVYQRLPSAKLGCVISDGNEVKKYLKLIKNLRENIVLISYGSWWNL